MSTLALAISALTCLIGQANTQAPHTGGYALVVGVDSYQSPWPRLKHGVKDAKAVADYLGTQGLRVTTLYDGAATKRAIIDYLEGELARKLRDTDRVVVYFSGHGTTESFNGQDFGYIVPADADRSISSYLSMEELRGLSQKMGAARQQLFIIDACYGGLFGDKSGLIPREHPTYISELWRRKSRLILTAGGKNQRVADGGPFGHSLFTGYFLKAVRDGLGDLDGDGLISFSELSAYLLPAASTELQTPTAASLAGHDRGEFVFSLGKAKADTNVDTDGDGVPDVRDRCPHEAETINDFLDQDGCADIKVSTLLKSFAPPVWEDPSVQLPSTPEVDSCLNGNGDSCALAASVLKDSKQILRLGSVGCVKGSGVACTWAALGAQRLGEQAKSHAYARHGCESLSDGASCVWFARAEYESGNRVRALEISTAYCETNPDLGACAWAARLSYENGNRADTRKFAQRGCNTGVLDACSWLIVLEHEQKNHAAARELAVRGCDKKHALSCSWAANIYYQLNDLLNTQVFGVHACEGGDGDGCAWAARALSEGNSPAAAASFAVRGCRELKHGVSCSWAASLAFSRGEQRAALEYAQEGCRLQSADSCDWQRRLSK